MSVPSIIKLSAIAIATSVGAAIGYRMALRHVRYQEFLREYNKTVDRINAEVVARVTGPTPPWELAGNDDDTIVLPAMTEPMLNSIEQLLAESARNDTGVGDDGWDFLAGRLGGDAQTLASRIETADGFWPSMIDLYGHGFSGRDDEPSTGA